ncbi:MAG: patatin-like phospholipase family protein [Thermoanaerobaculia bacterium]|nr:patatin-like phospholipase family protein [Thermoanaerobaculia bacterium]MCZ7649719.1 patatin-like phospholipase family protein [Thermoanaerobaculia bacterium]
MRSALVALLLPLALLVSLPAAAEDPPLPLPVSDPVPAERPRVALVLSGGGARGAAHVGVIEVLEELRVPVDLVVGTSMGAVVGALWASGLDAADLKRILAETDWREAFSDRTPRQHLAFRRKQDDDSLLMKVRLGVQGKRIRMPLGALQGQRLELVFRRLTAHVATVDDFDRLPIPFRAVATDIVSGEKVVLAGGDLVTAIRASLAVPGAFAPVEYQDRLLVDGGLADNLPVDVARAWGAEVVIAVDISAQPLPREKLLSALQIGDQMLTILMRRDTERQLTELGARDIAILPDMGEMTSVDFSAAADAVARGERAAREVAGRLAALSLPPDRWARWQERHTQRPAAAPDVEEVRIGHDTRLATSILTARLETRPGRPLDTAALERDLARLYGTELFEKVGYELLPGEAGGVVLDIEARRKRWGTSYLRFGLGLADDLEGDTQWSLGARLNLLELTPRGAELRTDLRIGEEQLLGSELYLPFGGAGLFFAPRLGYARQDVPLVVDGDVVSRYRREAFGAALDLGRSLGDWGELRLGLERDWGTLRLQTGSRSGQPLDFDEGKVYLRLFGDTLDSVAYPTSGHALFVEVAHADEALGADGDYDLLAGRWQGAQSWGRHTLVAALEGATVLSDLGPREPFRLGGFLRLSGTVPDGLFGRHLGLARLVYKRRLGGGLGRLVDAPLYLGGSLEAGNVWERRSAADLDTLRFAGSVFVGLDSALGPATFAWGRTDDGEDRWYFYLGRAF